MSLELKRIQTELMKVTAARMELELRIEERKDEIKRIEDHIKVQLNKEEELKQKIKDMGG